MRQPAFYISHGGGPCFWMEFPPPIGPHGFDRLKDFLAGLPELLPARPSAYLVISAHWETDGFRFGTSPQPDLIYDYYGFPPHTYELTHPAAGDAELAERASSLLTAAGLHAGVDAERGLDHGVFVPFKIIDPDAEIPIVPMSIAKGYDPELHMAAGRALAPLREEGVAIVASGSSFHDLKTYFNGQAGIENRFDDWLTDAVTADPAQREKLLAKWLEAPGARASHPKADHLIPLMVAAGAGEGDSATQVYKDVVAEKQFSGYRFG